MKKLLLGSTALVGAIALAGAAHAGGAAGHSGNGMSSHAGGGLEVTVGGFIDFQAGFTDQEQAFETPGTGNDRDADFQNDTEIHIMGDGVADNGLRYGFVIELNADVSDDADDDGGNADKTFIYLESDAGRVELGANTGAQSTLGVSAGNIARATGGVDGDFYDFVNLSGGFIIRPDLPSGSGGIGDAREDANKITYYTPVFEGFQFGVSYTPDEGDSGTAIAQTGESNGNQENVFGLALNYANNFDGVGVEAAVTGEFGESELATVEDTSAWSFGLILSYQGFSVAGSYTDWEDSGLATGATNDDQDLYTLGAAYETGPFGVSVTWLDSEQQDREFENLVVGADYQLAEGLLPYAEVSFFETDDNVAATTDNDGTVVLLGVQASF